MTEIQDTPLNAAINHVTDIFRLADLPDPPFPPAEVFSEGWMLRLALDTHQAGHGGIPVPIVDGARWYSEARLTSPFQPSRRGDPNGEGQTHADGVVGHFDFRPATTAGLALRADATQFAVIEAKMGSKLSHGTSRVIWYDQAVRNVAAMAWTLTQHTIAPNQLTGLSFIVVAPEDRIKHDSSFRRYMTKDSINVKVRRRIDLYTDDDPARFVALTEWHDTWFVPFIDLLDLQLVSWEDVIANTNGAYTDELAAFYAQCRRHNGLDDK